MPNLKLAKLPDRRNIKITVSVPPDLDKALKAYAEVYRESYGDEEEVSTLIPYMLERFLASDRGFAKAQKSTPDAAQPRVRRPRARAGTSMEGET
jgi:hypothetical protein